jgi:hypothetical protein
MWGGGLYSGFCGMANALNNFHSSIHSISHRLCGLVVSVPGYRSRGSGFDSRCYQIFWEIMVVERSPFSLVRTTAELLEWKRCGSGLENPRLTAVRIRCASHATPFQSQKLALNSLTSWKKLALISLTSCDRSVGIVRLRTKGHGVTSYITRLLKHQSIYSHIQ